ncbi:cyclic nucleotide-binding domain-containing protein [Anditalea andensis]|uniref:Cyclic nucleotide-binding domain-containing protein n=1 Tax=Anditalea andensis TaxID=1048983 RepID=A0A074L0B9_9BACT|nr:hypothetical protein [Anditalea andensis]KEO75666.1 hypothetical protein EL17_23900 [Anditalea andensis]
MNSYKRMLEIKTYAVENGIWYEHLFKLLFEETKLLQFDKNVPIILSEVDPYHLFFVHKGAVLGFDPHSENVTRVVLPREMFGLYEYIEGMRVNKISWKSMGKVSVTGISITRLFKICDMLSMDINCLPLHLSSLEMTGTGLFTNLSLLSLPDKITLLESSHPRLLIELNWKILASYLHVRPESLSREISRRGGL